MPTLCKAALAMTRIGVTAVMMSFFLVKVMTLPMAAMALTSFSRPAILPEIRSQATQVKMSLLPVTGSTSYSAMKMLTSSRAVSALVSSLEAPVVTSCWLPTVQESCKVVLAMTIWKAASVVLRLQATRTASLLIQPRAFC